MLNFFKQMMPFIKNIHDGYKSFIMNIVISLCKKTITRIERLYEKDFFQVVKVQCLLQSWKRLTLRQKVWKGLHESKVGQMCKKLSKIEKHYQLQPPKKKADPS
jgi:poly(A) polymerase Pap1